MILEEVCRDIIKTHEIIMGLMKYGNIDHAEERDLHFRQQYRRRFQEFIVDGIRKRYGHQANIFYEYDPQHEELKNIEKRSIQARTLLLEISKLAIQNNICLKYDEEQDWYQELIKSEHIRVKINMLINMIAD